MIQYRFIFQVVTYLLSLAHKTNTSLEFLTLDTPQAQQSAFSNNTVSVGVDGTFAVTITANPGWSIGKHTIKASEAPTHRSTSLDFTIYLAGTTPGPTTTGSTSPTSHLLQQIVVSNTHYDAYTYGYGYPTRFKLC